MRKFAAIVLLLLAVPALAQEQVYRNGNTSIRLLASDCPSAQLIVRLGLAGNQQPAKAASVTISGRELTACWGVDEDADILLEDERGTGGFLPRTAFSKPSGI